VGEISSCIALAVLRLSKKKIPTATCAAPSWRDHSWML
jgi:hypothetical protein